MAHDRETLRKLVNQLDESVPREGARARLDIGAGPDESCFVANEAGYLRFGVELLKAGLADPDPASKRLPVDLDYIVTEESDIQFDAFVSSEDLSTPMPAGHDLTGLAIAIVFMAAVAFAGIGLITVITWLV